jgi:predicted nucleic acid-binding protein
MNGDRLFLDTVYIQARLNRADQYHGQAVALAPRVRSAAAVVTTEAVLTESANALSAINRAGICRFIEQAYRTRNIQVIDASPALFQGALDLYRSRQDKQWGLTDCISFIVMHNYSVTDALTADEHFTQAGFNTLLAPRI